MHFGYHHLSEMFIYNLCQTNFQHQGRLHEISQEVESVLVIQREAEVCPKVGVAKEEDKLAGDKMVVDEVRAVNGLLIDQRDQSTLFV